MSAVRDLTDEERQAIREEILARLDRSHERRAAARARRLLRKRSGHMKLRKTEGGYVIMDEIGALRGSPVGAPIDVIVDWLESERA